MQCRFPVVAANEIAPLAKMLTLLVQKAPQEFDSYVWIGIGVTQNTVAKKLLYAFSVGLKAVGQSAHARWSLPSRA